MERGAEPEKYMMVYRSMEKAPAEHYGGSSFHRNTALLRERRTLPHLRIVMPQ